MSGDGVRFKASDVSSFNIMKADSFEVKDGFFSGRKVTVSTKEGDSITLTFNQLYKEFERLSAQDVNKPKLAGIFLRIKLIDAANKTLNPLAKLPNLFFNRTKVIHNTAENISSGKGNISEKLYEFSQKHPDLAIYSEFLEKALLSKGSTEDRLDGLTDVYKERPLNKTSFDEWTKICEDLMNKTNDVSAEDKELIMSSLQELGGIIVDKNQEALLKAMKEKAKDKATEKDL